MDVVSNILSNIKINPRAESHKDVEVIIEKNELYSLLKILFDQLIAVIERLKEVASERDIVVI